MSGPWPRPLLPAVVALVLGLSACTTQPAVPGSVPSSASMTAGAHGSWQRIPDGPLSARQGGVAIWLRDRFLVLGGSRTPACPPNASCTDPVTPPLRDGAAFDPRTSRWTRIADAPFAPEYYHVPVVVGGLLYLSAQDATGTGPKVLAAYDAAYDRWSHVPFPPVPHPQLVAAGATLVAVSQSSRGLVRYDEAGRRWRSLPADPLGSAGDRRAAWAASRLLIAAPTGAGRASDRVELASLDGSLRTWHRMIDRRGVGGLLETAGDTVRFWTCQTRCPEGETLDVATGVWSPAPVIPRSKASEPTCTPRNVRGSVADRDVVASGLYDWRSRTWSALPNLPVPLCVNGEVAAAGGDAILVWGGTVFHKVGGDLKRVNSAAGWLLRP